MLVVQARAMGMCFGVKDALEAARSHPEPARVTIHGELVHNPAINLELAQRGFQMSGEGERGIPPTAEVMITAHGVSQRERRRLEEAGKRVVDTTCPLVRRVHKTAMHLSRQGYLVVVVGRPDHVEVQGLVGDLERHVVIPTPEQARPLAFGRLAVLAQTTTAPRVFAEVVAALRQLNPDSEVKVVDTICSPTRDRQEALHELLSRVEALVVVGGQHSNNTRQLSRLARERGVPCAQVERADELDLDWASQFRVVGLTAGTSTPDEVIQAVHRRLRRARAPQARAAV